MEYKDKKYTYLGGLVHGISTLATGMKTSIKVYFRKKVTEQYPENRKELKMFDRFRGTLNMPHNENNEHRCVAWRTVPNGLSERYNQSDQRNRRNRRWKEKENPGNL